MAGNIDQPHANNVIDASLGTATIVATVTPLKLALMSVVGSNTAAGTEVTGGSYAAQSVAFSAASAGATSNSGAVTFSAMPAITTNGIELRDNSGTPKRKWLGNLAAAKTTGSGDTLTFAIGSVTVSMP
jgi:hypothetical protein